MLWYVVFNRCHFLKSQWLTITQFDRWIGLAAFGNAIELLLTLLPLALVWSLQMPFKSKVLVLFAFSFRLP